MNRLLMTLTSVALFCSPTYAESLEEKVMGDWCMMSDPQTLTFTLRNDAFYSNFGACKVTQHYMPEEGKNALKFEFDFLCRVDKREALQNIHAVMVLTKSPSGDAVLSYSLWPLNDKMDDMFPVFTTTTACAKGVASGY
jgi:hypothetical protein